VTSAFIERGKQVPARDSSTQRNRQRRCHKPFVFIDGHFVHRRDAETQRKTRQRMMGAGYGCLLFPGFGRRGGRGRGDCERGPDSGRCGRPGGRGEKATKIISANPCFNNLRCGKRARGRFFLTSCVSPVSPSRILGADVETVDCRMAGFRAVREASFPRFSLRLYVSVVKSCFLYFRDVNSRRNGDPC
jgi:hypothetical protein